MAAHGLSYLIPLLQQAKSLNPQLTFMATPWSAPGWMKTTGNMAYEWVMSPAYLDLTLRKPA